MAFLLFLSLLLSTILLYLFLLRLSRPKRHLPPGRLGLPLIGETLQFFSAFKSENPESFSDGRVKRYGALFTTHLLGSPTVFSADPDVNRFVLQNEGKLFEGSYPSSISNLLGRHSLVLMKGSLHKKMHSLTMSFANSIIIKDHLLADMDRIIRMNLDSWDRRVLLLDEAKKMTFGLSMKQLMSFDPNEWTERLRKEYLLVMDGFFALPVPLFFTTYGRAINARTKVADALRSVVRERRKALKESSNNENNKSRKDMLGAMLEGETAFSDEQIVDFLLALLVAGYETTSTLMTLAIKFLTETPLALAQLKEEHEGIRRKKNIEALEWSDYKSMPFTQCVINETLRVANIVGGVFRRATADVNIKGYTIPKGWKVFASFRAVHLDKEYHKDARKYDPWRWQNKEDSSVPPSTASSQGNTYTPFGGGARLCPGYELARVQISVFLHHLVTKYSWEPAEEDKLVFFPTTRTLKNYPIYVHRLERP